MAEYDLIVIPPTGIPYGVDSDLTGMKKSLRWETISCFEIKLKVIHGGDIIRLWGDKTHSKILKRSRIPNGNVFPITFAFNTGPFTPLWPYMDCFVLQKENLKSKFSDLELSEIQNVVLVNKN